MKDIEIQNAWKELANKKFSNTIKKETIMNAIKTESNSSISQLKKGLKIKLCWAIGIGLGILGFLLFNLGNNDMVILLSIAFAAYAYGSISMYFTYRKIDLNNSDNSDLLTSMKYNTRHIKTILRGEKTWGLIIFIPAVVIGMLLAKVNNGQTIVESFNDAGFLKAMIGAIVVLVPLMFWMTQKMNKSALGKDLKILEDNIVKMETLV